MNKLVGLLLGTALTLPFAPAAMAQDLFTVNMINPLPRSANFYPLIVGEALGYFEEEGVEVNLLPSDTSLPYVAFVMNGQAHLAMLDPFETINAVNAGMNIATVYEVMQSAPEGIAAPAGNGVESMADLEGKTVGLVSDRDRAFLSMALDTAGLTLDDVETVVVGESGPTLANAFRNNTIAALSGAVPDWLAIQSLGVEINMITPEELLRSPANTFAMNADSIEELREPIEGFLRAWSKGQYVARVDPEAVAAMAKAAVPEEWENEEFGQQFLDASIQMNLSITDQIGALQEDVWADLQPRMLEVGLIEEVVPVESFLNDTYIEAANDFDRDEVADEAAAWREENM